MKNAWNCLIPSKAPMPIEGRECYAAGHGHKTMSGIYKYESGVWWWEADADEWVEFSPPIYWSYVH
jgi:hypothetical protein